MRWIGLLLALTVAACARPNVASAPAPAAKPRPAEFVDGFPEGYAGCIRYAARRTPYTDAFLDECRGYLWIYVSGRPERERHEVIATLETRALEYARTQGVDVVRTSPVGPPRQTPPASAPPPRSADSQPALEPREIHRQPMPKGDIRL